MNQRPANVNAVAAASDELVATLRRAAGTRAATPLATAGDEIAAKLRRAQTTRSMAALLAEHEPLISRMQARASALRERPYGRTATQNRAAAVGPARGRVWP